MRIQCLKEDLLKTIQIIESVVPMRSSLNILSNILMEAQKGKLKLISTDLEIGISKTITTEVLEEGAITLPAKRFLEIIREMPESLINITTKKNNIIDINCEKSFFKIMGLPKEEFPSLPKFKDERVLTLNQNLLKKMLISSSFAVSHEELRYVLNGVLFEVEKSFLRLVATDGRRLVKIERKLDLPENLNYRLIMPIKAAQELIKNLKEEGMVNLTLGENQVLFEFDELQIFSRLIEGEFPNWRQVIPEESENKVRLDKNNFLWAIRRASLFTTPDSQVVKMDLFKDKMIISKSTPEIGEVKEELDVGYKGKELSIGFNPRYILDVLRHIETEELDFELTAADKPGVIRQEGFLYIVLPMQLT